MIEIETAITGGIMLSNAKVRPNEIVVPNRADFASWSHYFVLNQLSSPQSPTE
jgi:hypothetical protein